MQAEPKRWRLPQGDAAPADMVFLAEPPPQIGAVIGGWTNNGPLGPKLAPLSQRLTPVWLGAMGGFVLGLIGFFVVGGILENSGTRISGDAFLLSLAGGLLIGVFLGVLRMRRPPQVLTLFVGAEGCVQIEGHGPDAKLHLLEFREIHAMRTHVSVMVASGIRTAVREIHVKPHDGKERLWYLTTAPGEQKADDPQYHFGEAVLAAFAAYRADRGGRV